MSPAISLRGVSKQFRIPLDRSTTLKSRLVHPLRSSRHQLFDALTDVTFDVPPGQFLGVIGPNGAGKSTLLKIMARILPPSSGAIEVAGQISPFLELGVGFNPELTARENVFVNGAILGLTRAELKGRVDEIIGFADLEEFADRKLKSFSSGMQVRLAFSVAIQADAAVLLMDEVLAVGDASFQQRCFDVFGRYKREGRTVILVTHDLSSVERYCDRAILLESGRVADDGPPSEVAITYRRHVAQRWDHLPEVSAGPRRSGTGAVRIRRAALVDGQGRQHATFPSLKPMALRLEFEAEREVDGLTLGFNLHRSDGVQLATSDTSMGSVDVPCPPRGQVGVVTYSVDYLALMGGGYYFSVFARGRGADPVYDQIEDACPFHVVDETGYRALPDIGGGWHLERALISAKRREGTASS